MKVLYEKIAYLPLLVGTLATFSVPTITIANPPISLLEQAKVHVAPHRAFKLQYGNLQALIHPLYTTVNNSEQLLLILTTR